MKKKYLLLISAFLSLTACGFEPLHGTAFQSEETRAVQENLSQIEIASIPDAEGQFLRNELIDRFYAKQRPVNPQYRLRMGRIKERRISLGVTKDDDTTRGQMILSTTLQLYVPRQAEPVLTRKVQSVISYNRLGSEFGTIVSEDNARENALRDMTSQIERQLALYFRR